MVETQELRDAFVARLNKALDEKDGVRKGRGRNVDFFEGLRTQPAFSASTQATHKWLKAESMPGRANMLAIAEWLGVRVEWLQYGEGDMRHGDPQSQDVATLTLAEKRAPGARADPLVHSNVAPTQQPHRAAKEYPLISWVAAGCWQESCDNFQPGSADEWLLSSENAGPHGYWLEVKGASMLPTFTERMRILVQPEGFDLVSGKFYIAKLIDTGETTFKQYVRDAGLEFLQPLNTAYPTLQITDNVRIIGRVVDAKIAPSLLL